jgi:rhamnose transport system permease protein
MSESQTMTAAPVTRTYADYAHPLWRRVLFTREAAVIGALLIVIVYALFGVKHFAQPITAFYLLQDVMPILLIALPMTLIIITGEIDLSVASIVALSSVTLGTLTSGGMPIGMAAIIAIVVGAIGGAINGFLITVVGLPSLAVTIGSLALFRGLAVGILGTKAVTTFDEGWKDFAKSKIPGTPVPTVLLIFVVLAIIFVLLLHFTAFGRGIYAIGLSSEAALFSGVRVNRTKFLLFVMSAATTPRAWSSR